MAAKRKGLEVTLPGGGTMNTETRKITPPKPKVTPAPKPGGTGSMNGPQYDAHLRKIIAQMNKPKKRK
jgi:hypothetical protein